MKASRFVKAFEMEVDKWERTLSHILEVVEILLTVQRQWMYLENIFLGEDIRKQLPRESADFDNINANWKVIMTRLNKDKNALRGTHHKGMRETHHKGMRGTHHKSIRGSHHKDMRGKHHKRMRGTHHKDMRGTHHKGMRGTHHKSMRGCITKVRAGHITKL